LIICVYRPFDPFGPSGHWPALIYKHNTINDDFRLKLEDIKNALDDAKPEQWHVIRFETDVTVLTIVL